MADNTLEQAIKIKEEGNAYFRNNNFLKAIETYTLCLSIKDHPDFYNNRAAAYMKMGMYDLALFDLNNVFDYQANQKAMKRSIFILKGLNLNKDAHAALKEYLKRYPHESEELRAISVDIDQNLRISLNKFDKLIILKTNDGVTVRLQEDLNGKRVLYELEKEKSTVEAQLSAHPIEQILIYGVVLDRELADLFNKIDSVYLRDSPLSKFEICDVDFSLMPKATFNELFGQMIRPNRLSFIAVRGIDARFFIRNVKNFAAKYVDVMPVEKATNPIVNMTEFVQCIGSKIFDICPKPLSFRTNQHLFGLKIGDIVNKLHEAFQVETVQITYRLVIYCRLKDVHEWIQELCKRRVLKGDNFGRILDVLFKNTESSPEEMINAYNETTKERFVVKIRKSSEIGMDIVSVLNSNIKCDKFDVSVQIYCEF
ncbi:hypothetical protein Ddc_17103 [Ditylenchus destructor]|nr:hypothetical protein Ddc_17103 [Ditylenchus destructor]